jgi:AcrR family transcriptional regulator
VAAARELLLEGGFYQMRMEDVARRSGVTRATVFNQFGSKLALLQAIAAEAGQRSRSQTTFEAQKLPDAYDAFRGSLTEGYRFFAAERMMFRQIISLAAVDPEAKELVAGFEQNRRNGMKEMADRLAKEGYLKAGWSRRSLADLLWIATSFETFDLLHSGRRLSAKASAERVLAIASVGLNPARRSMRKPGK